MAELGRLLMIIGGGLLAVGALVYFGSGQPWFGRLPGDILVRRGNFTVFAPIGTMIVLSILLSLALNLVGRWMR